MNTKAEFIIFLIVSPYCEFWLLCFCPGLYLEVTLTPLSNLPLPQSHLETEDCSRWGASACCRRRTLAESCHGSMKLGWQRKTQASHPQTSTSIRGPSLRVWCQAKGRGDNRDLATALKMWIYSRVPHF